MNFLDLLDKNISSKYERIYDGHYLVNVELQHLESTLSELYDKCAMILLVDIIGIDLREDHGQFEVIYVLSNMNHGVTLDVSCLISEQKSIPSVSSIWKNATGLELELFDLLGIKISGIDNKRIFNHYKFIGHPLQKNFTSSDFEFMSHADIGVICGPQAPLAIDEELLNIGPFHPAMDSGMRLLTKISDETIKTVGVEVGMTHKGVEKALETFSFKKLVSAGRMLDTPYPETFNILFAHCIEEFFGIVVPERAKVIRMFILELERLAVHLDAFIRIGRYLKGEMVVDAASVAREILQIMINRLFKMRATGSATRLGGVVNIFKDTSVFSLFESINSLRKQIEKIKGNFYSIDSWMNNLDNMDISSNLAISWGITGPALRSSGVNWDLRKRIPIYFYGDLDFAIPCGVEGRSYDRYVVRLEEMFQSLSILEQLLDYIPTGELICDLSEFKFSKKGRMSVRLEGPNGELMVTMLFNGENGVNRVKIRPSTFPMCLGLEEFMKGKLLNDALLGMMSLNIVATEIDR